MKIAYLEKSIPEENQYRYYSIYIARTLFGHWALVREWGRLGQKGGQRKEEWYEKETDAGEEKAGISKNGSTDQKQLVCMPEKWPILF